MEIFHSFQEVKGCQHAVVALGTFDGVHMGHQKVMQKAIEEADMKGYKSVVVTFSGHPLSVLQPDKEPVRLATMAQKIQYIQDVGIDVLVILPLSWTLLNETPQSFCQQLYKTFLPSAIVVGTNFTYGAGADGNTDTLRAFMELVQVPVYVLPLVSFDKNNMPVSSTIIRQLIQDGKLEETTHLLGRPFSIVGTVVTGDKRGRTIGFPTANMHIEKNMAVPADGVYVSEVKHQGILLPAMTNVGENPTFANQYRRIETYILDWHGDIYGQDMELHFLKRLRGEERFHSVEELVACMKQDEEKVRNYFRQRSR
ncbi:bifunctional riboflavin kinase/FAD synthetase [Megasphaera hutchinsoni]|jgi:hypothetical protein|uniref:Riboflavin biosynthesis protein n=1 Tax=Megasphaera hutchinsoni TaxID=1588748 RepID=A0A134CFL2_9FIRM|nr:MULTISPECIES: bifunctional riboflavin kinase/FAD synthetase [Megasphaera]KXB90894.1 riboflavin biosynthesis protein RibF [Megasphaera hutchinsoni]PNH22567.1 riboflavin biosynthesis protein RibF [Megasphaera genomosp. type_2]